MVIRAGLHDNIFPPGMIPEDHQPTRQMVPSLRLDMAVEAFQDSSPLILVLLEVILFYNFKVLKYLSFGTRGQMANFFPQLSLIY